MALHWDISEVAAEAKTDDEWAITETLIWHTLFVGISKITESNAVKFAERVSMYERAFGTLVSVPDGGDGFKSHHITLADVRLRIGLGTNASNLTDAAFRKQVIDRMERKAQARVERAQRELDKAAALAASETAVRS